MLSIVIGDDWYPIIGDPTWIGWITVVAYFAAAFVCRRAAELEQEQGERLSSRRFWRGFTWVLVFLGVNKQLDLQTWMTTIAKKLAKSEGWYDHRRPVQIIFIGLVFLAGLAIFCWFVWLARGAFRRHWMALAGGIYLGVFIMVRASSFHHVDQLLGLELGGIKVNWALELGGILWVAVSAVRNIWLARCQSARVPLRDGYMAGGN